MKLRLFAVLAFLCFAAGGAGASAQTKPPAPPAPGASGAPAAASPAPKPGDIPAYDTFVKDAVVQNGLFTLVRKDGKVYLVVKGDQLDRDYLQTAVPKNGLGGYGILSGDVFQQEARIVRFIRNGKNVVMLWPHTRFLADPNTPLAEAVRLSTADSVMGVGGIVAERKDGDKAVVVDLTPLLGDVMNLTDSLNATLAPPTNPMAGAYHLDPTRSYFGVSKAFPKNVLIEADQSYVSFKPTVIDTVVDPRSFVMRIAYNFTELPDASQYMPRLVDDRVGYWDDLHIAFDHVERMDNRVHYVLRWNLKASDPSKPLSPAVQPIVYTLANSIPLEYREPIKTAILAWNKPFEKIGISDAVKVQDQPSDPDFDPDDVRYNMIRWLTESNSGGFAEAQITWDPRDGQIFRSGVMIDSDLVRFGATYYNVLGLSADGEEDPARDERLDAHSHFAHNDGPGAHAQLMYASIAQALMQNGDPATIAQRTSKEFLHAIVMHEVGHDFGLAHNFIGHMAYSRAQVRDRRFTEQNGIASSVMEYNPANVWPAGESSGTIEQSVLGPYDYHVIRWGYAPIAGAKTPDDELPTLDRWASNWIDPRYRFASDEDVAWIGGHAIDPRVHQFTLTNDPLGWCTTQMNMVSNLIGKVDTKFPRAEHPYEEERAAFAVLVGQYGRCATNTAHWIGGEYLSRSRRGDPRSETPLTPVARADEQRAFAMLDRYVFSNDAWHYDPATLRRLVYSQYETFSNFGYAPTPRHDVSVADMATRYQLRTLQYLFAPMVLARLDDLPTKAKPGETMTLSDLFTWSQRSIYGDIANGKVAQATQVRRNLQRRYEIMLGSLAVGPRPGVPFDAQALARYELTNLNHDVAVGLARRDLDVQTRAHLTALQNDVNRTLHAQQTISS